MPIIDIEYRSLGIGSDKRRGKFSTRDINLLLKKGQVEREKRADCSSVAVKETKQVESESIHYEDLSRLQPYVELKLRVV